MVEVVTAVLGSRMQLLRDEVSMSIMKKRLQAEQTMAQMLIDAAENVEQISNASPNAQGSAIDIYV